MFDANYLRSLLSYDGHTGIFTWRVSRGRAHIGMVAGKTTVEGYIHIGIDGRQYGAHRLAWLYTFGHWPKGEIDHIDCNKINNALENLRLATRSQNQANQITERNNSSGIKGVVWHAQCRKWQAQIAKGGKTFYLGLFTEKSAAQEAYFAAAREHFGEFAR